MTSLKATLLVSDSRETRSALALLSAQWQGSVLPVSACVLTKESCFGVCACYACVPACLSSCSGDGTR